MGGKPEAARRSPLVRSLKPLYDAQVFYESKSKILCRMCVLTGSVMFISDTNQTGADVEAQPHAYGDQAYWCRRGTCDRFVPLKSSKASPFDTWLYFGDAEAIPLHSETQSKQL
jgi:hypothetical protein